MIQTGQQNTINSGTDQNLEDIIYQRICETRATRNQCVMYTVYYPIIKLNRNTVICLPAD